jgi:hypothetical protein
VVKGLRAAEERREEKRGEEMESVRIVIWT